MEQESAESPFIADWRSVRDTPEYGSASNAGRFSMFRDWANGTKSRMSKELEEAPEEKRPELESRFSALNDFIEERKDFLGKKYDLAYRTTKLMEDGYNEDLLAEFRDPRKLINEGFDPNEVMAIRNQIEEEIAPVLFRAKRGLAAPIPDIGVGYTMEQAKKDVWEEAGMLDMLRDSVTKAAPYLLGQGIIKGLGGGIWKYGAQAMRMMDMTGDPDNAVTTYMDAAGKQMAELGDKIAGKPDSLFPNDPRFGKYQSSIVSGAQQMPGQLGMAAIPGAGVALSMASNVGLMYQENVDTFEQDIKQTMFEQGQEEGTISESTPFSQWEKTLDEKAKREIREKAAGVAFVLAPAQGAVETLSDKFVLLKDAGGFLPDSAKKAMMRARHARPATYMATRILTNAGIKSGVEGFEEVFQETGKNIGSAYFTGDYSLDRIFKNADTAFVGGVAGGGAATVMTAGQIFKTERALDYANSILGDKNQINEAIQNDLRLLDGSLNSDPEAPRITDKEKAAAENRLAKANPVEVQHQRDLMTLGDTSVDKESMEFKEASRRVQRRMDEANWILSKVGGRLGEDGEKRAARYEAVTKARTDFQGMFDAHIKQNFPNLDFAEVARATAKRVAEVRANYARIRKENAATGVLTGETANILDRSEKAAIEQAQRSGGKQVQEAEKVLTDFIGSLDSDGPGRAAFARQRLSELYPDAVFAPWFKDDAVVTELLNARERGEINDSTDLQSWLDTAVVSKKGEGEKSDAAPEKPQGLMTTQQRRDAVRLAEDNLEGARPEVLKEFNRLKEDLEFHHAKLENKDSSEADRAEAAKILPELENQLLEFIYALQDQGALADPVSSQSTNQNDQDQTQNQATLPTQKVPATGATGEGTGTGMGGQLELDFAGGSGTAPQAPAQQGTTPPVAPVEEEDPAAPTVEELVALNNEVIQKRPEGSSMGFNPGFNFNVPPSRRKVIAENLRASLAKLGGTESQDGQTGKSSGSYPEVEGSSPSPATPASDTAAIVAEVQANPEQHRMMSGAKKIISRKGAVAILAQLPDTVTNKDIATLAKNSGTTSAKLKALIQLRDDRPDAVEYLLSGSADIAFDLFDSDIKKAAPKAAATPTTQTQADADPDPQDNITEEPEEETEEDTDTDLSDVSPVDSWVDTAFAAIKDAVDSSNQSSGKLELLRAALATKEGEADIRERLAKMFNFISTKLQIDDPVVREAALRKIFYGEASQTGKGITSSVLQDLLFNVKKTGSPFFVKSKSKEEVPYSAWNKHQNKRKEFVAEAATRDAGDSDQEGSSGGDVETDAVQDPDREARMQEYERMRADMIRSVYEDVTDRWAEKLAMRGVDKEDVRLALLQLLAEQSGVGLNPQMMGWETRGGRAKVKPTVKSALEKQMDEVRADLFTSMKNGLTALREEAKEAGVTLSDAVPQITAAPTLEDVIELGVIDQMKSAELVNKAKEAGSPEALLPLLRAIDPAYVQKVAGTVLNDGKEVTDKDQIASFNRADMQAVLDSGLLPDWQREALQALIDLSGKDGLGIVKQSKNEGFRLLSELYSRRIGESARPVEVVFNLALNPSTTGQGMWDPKNPNKVHISPFLTREQGLMDATILHEVGHSIWDKKVQDFQQGRFSELSQKDIEVLQELRLLYTAAKAEARKRIDAETDPQKKQALARDLLGVKPLEDTGDLSEFLNEALNHKPFQDFLNGIKDPNSKEGVSLFRRILNKIVELMHGKPVALDSILQRSFELSVKLAGDKPAIGQAGSLDTRQQRDLAAGQTLSDAELENFNFERQTADQPILSSEMVVTDQQVFEAIKANGGVTVDVWTAGQPGTGIVVAPFKQTETKIPLNNFTPEDVKAFMRKFRPLLEVPGMHLGGWISDDTVYLDVSIVTEDEVTATLLAEDGNQLAAYNIGTGELPSTPELVARNSGALAERRSDPDFQNLARALQQAFGRTMGGLRGEGSPNVQGERALPEISLIESLTGRPATQDELNQIAESAPVKTGTTDFQTASNQYQLDASEPAGPPTGFERIGDTESGARSDYQAGRRVGENASLQTNIGRDAARNSRTDVTQGTELTGDGRSFADFFAKVTGNKDARFIPVNPYRPAIPLGPSATGFKATRDKYRGNFDAHIATSIPGFDEVQAVVGSALLKTFGQTGAELLDIGTSEGGLIKALADSSGGRIQSVGIDPNKAMMATFDRKPQAQGAEFSFSAFGSAEDAGKVAWREDDGTEVYTFDPKGRTFDVVHEAMVFQFISNARNAQVARVKSLMKPGGLAIFEEKFGGFADEYDAAEKQKDSDWKALFFTPEQIQAKQQEVLSRGGDEIEGMTDKQVAWWEMEKVLTSNFKNVVQFWSSGNFRGYAASDDLPLLKNFVSNMQPTDTVFSTQATPREIRESRAVSDLFIPAPDDKFQNFMQILDYVSEKYTPVAIALGSDIAYDFTGHTAKYTVIDNRGRKHVIEYNPAKLLGYTRREIDATMREELIHAASGTVLQRKGIDWVDFYEDLAGLMTSRQRASLKSVYRSTRDNKDVGAEFFRASVQKFLYGTITEAERKTPAIKKILDLFREVVAFWNSRKVDPVVREVFNETMDLMRRADKKNLGKTSSGIKKSESVPEQLGRLWQEAVEKEGGDAFAYGEVSPNVKSFTEVFTAVTGENPIDAEVFLQEMQVKKKSKEDRKFALGFYTDGNAISEEEFEKAVSSNGLNEVWIKDPEGGVTVFFTAGPSAASGIYAVNSAGTKIAGSQIYQSLYAWAHNNGKIIGPDTSLSKVAEIRRTSQMLSSALRFGTTEHMRPSAEQQIKGWRRVERDKNGELWEISGRLREISGGIFIDDTLDSARPRRPDGRLTGSQFNQYNEFHSDTGLATFTQDNEDPNTLFRPYKGYEVRARKVTLEEAQQAWRENIGLLALKEAELIFERLPELRGLNISKDGNLFGPDTDYPGSVQALPAGNLTEYLRSLKEAIRGVDPEFAGRIGPATLARALATRYAQTNKSNPSLRAANAEGSGSGIDSFSPFEGILYSAPVNGAPEAIDYIRQYGLKPPKGQSRSLIEIGGTPLFAEIATTDKSNQRSIKRAINAMLQNTTKNGRVRMGRVLFEELLSNVWQDAHKGTKRKPGWVNFQDARGVNRLAEILAYEVADALSKDASGVDWYRAKIDGMYSEVSKLFPELATEGRDRLYFSVLLATTSNGQKVYDNLLDALEIYSSWVEAGRPNALPENFTTRRTERLSAVRAGVQAFNNLVETSGADWQKAKDFMLQEITVGDLSKQFGKSISGERADQKLLGAMILGPKIGSFFANLNGNYSTITMDLWFTRTMNRVAGDLTKIDGAALAEKVKELIDNHTDELPPEVLEQTRVLSKSLGRNEAWASRPMEIRTEMDLFYDFVKQTLADYAKPDAEGKTYTNATPLKKLAQKIVKTIDGGEAIPDNGGHRKWMRQVMAEVQDRLQKAGIKIENADLQAILWFHEKDLYTEYGATSTGGERTDYQAAAGRIVEGSGSTSGGLADFIERLNAEEARRLRENKQRELSQEIQDELTGQTRFAFSAPVGYQPLGATMPGFTPTVYTAADREQTEALSRVMSDPAYASVRNALQNKTYFSYTEGETLRVATEFIDSANGGDIQKAFLTSGTSGGLTYEQTVLVRGLALKRAQEAANIARQERLDPNTTAARRRSLLFIEQKYDDMAEDFAATLMDMGSLAGQELRAFRLLADTLSPKKWRKAYMTAAIKARDRALKKDPVFKAMLERISFARRKAANDTTDRMLKALAAAAKGFIPKTVSPERVALHEKYARLMASQLTVKEEIMQAAVEKTVVDALDTIKEALVGQDVPQSILQVWENRIRSFASEQLEAAINQRLQGGQVDPERNPNLTEEQREQIRQQKIMDAWREVSDLPIAEQVFNLSRAWILSGDSQYTGLVRKAQFDPAKAKALRKAVKMSIDTAAEIRKSLLDRRMSVEALRIRLESIINSSNESTENPVLTQEQIDRLASAVEIVYNEEIKEATRAELDRIIRRNSETTTAKKVLENNTLSKLLPMVNMGALSDEAVYNAIAEDLGLPSWNADTAAEIERKAQELQNLPEGSLQRQEAGQELMSDILKENVKDGLKNLKSWNAVGYMLQIGSALWSAGILSAPPTHIINSGMSAVSVFVESLAEATGYYLNARMVGGISHDQAKEYFKDMARAWLFAFGKDANNTSLRVINEAYSGLTRGRSKFKAERLENLSPLEMFKLDPSVAIPANKMMEAVMSKDGNEAIKQAMKTAVGVAKRPEMYLGGLGVGLRGAVTGDFKGAAKNYAASMKLVGRLMLAADAVNSYGGSMAKQLMMRRYLAQQEGLSEQEVNQIVQDAYKGGQEGIRLEALNQAENEAERGDFGPAGTTDHEVRKARRVEQLIERQVFDSDTIEAGRDFAAVATFNSDPYGVIGWLMDTLFAGPTKVLGLVTKPINPFPKTMSNLLNAALNYTPVGSLRAEGWNISQLLATRTPFPQQFIRETPQRGTPEYIALHARAAAGSAAFGILYLMLMQAVKDREEGRRPWFEVHGAGPSDPDKLKQFLASGEKRFSLRVGDMVFNYTDWPSINLVLGVLGTLYDQMVYSDEDMDIADWGFQAARAIALTTLNRNALGGASALFEVFSASTPDEVAKSKLKQLASSYPTGFTRPSFTRWAETVATGTRQETKTFGGWLLSMLPVASAFRDRPSLNILGEPIKTTPWDATMGRVATTYEAHPILTPLTTAGLYINPPQRYEVSDSKSATGVRKMTDAEFYDYTKVWGETARKVLTPAVAEQLADAAVNYPNTAQDALNEITRAVGETARVRMAEEYGRVKGKAVKLP